MIRDDWEFNILGIYNYKKKGHLKHYFSFCEKLLLADNIKGDFCEFGVHKGNSLLALGLMLKEYGSKKKIYGFDTWDGFPSTDNKNDQFERWVDLKNQLLIDDTHFQKVKKNYDYIKFLKKYKVTDPGELSTSGNFSNCSMEDLQEKINFLKLDNIVLVKGPFSKTLIKKQLPNDICSALIDCDLYESYMTSLSWIHKRINKSSGIYLDEYYSLKFPGARIAVQEFIENKPNINLSKWGEDIGGFQRWGLTFEDTK